MRLRNVATVGPRVHGFGKDAVGDEVSFLPLDRIWSDHRFDPSESVEFSGSIGSYNPVNEGDILLPKVSPTFAHGRCAVARRLIGRRALATSEVFVVRAFDPLDAPFLSFCLRDPEFLQAGQSSWTGVAGLKRVSASFVADARITDRAWKTRHVIVERLSSLVAETERVRRDADRLEDALLAARTARLRDVLVGKGRRDSAEWHVRPLRSLARMKAGRSIPSTEIHPTGKYPVFGGNGIRGFASDYTHRGRHLLIGRQGALCGNVHDACGPIWASEHAVVVTPREGIDLAWLRAVLEAMNLNQYSDAAAQPGLSVERLRQLRVTVPPVVIQAELASSSTLEESSLRALGALSHVRSRLTTYRDSLIHEAVTGKLDVTTVSDAQMDERMHAAVEGRLDEVAG